MEWSSLSERMKESYVEGREGPNKCNCISRKTRHLDSDCQGWLNRESKLAGTLHRGVSWQGEGRRECSESQTAQVQLDLRYHSALTCQVLNETCMKCKLKIWCLWRNNMLNRTRLWYPNYVTFRRNTSMLSRQARGSPYSHIVLSQSRQKSRHESSTCNAWWKRFTGSSDRCMRWRKSSMRSTVRRWWSQ